MHEFVIKENGEILTFNKFEDIPLEFDHVIKFLPDFPEPPHTEEQHKEMEEWSARLQELMKRERK